MLVVDDAIFALLAPTEIELHKSYVDAEDQLDNPDVKVVTYPLPFAVYFSSVGDDHDPRLDGRTSRRSVFFSITYVGETAEHAKWAGEKIRDALESQRPAVAGHRSYLIDLLESQRIRRDDDAIRPDGTPLFYGVDNYAVSITRVRQEVSA